MEKDENKNLGFFAFDSFFFSFLDIRGFGLFGFVSCMLCYVIFLMNRNGWIGGNEMKWNGIGGKDSITETGFWFLQ